MQAILLQVLLTDKVIVLATFRLIFQAVIMSVYLVIPMVQTISGAFLGDVNIVGQDYVGALIGDMVNGSTADVLATGTVTGISGVYGIGGLIGQMNGGTLQEAYNGASVNGPSNVGGLIGQLNDFGSVSNTYSVGTV